MKKLTCSAFALTMTCAAGFASDSEWSALDQEVGALASTLSLQSGATISGRVATGYTNNSDFDIGGFSVSDARLAVDGSHGDYGYHIENDFADEGLRGAYATFAIGESVSGQIGQFRASVSNDADLDEGSMKHFMHSAIGGAFTGFTGGLGLSGEMSQISWAISLMNGADGIADELLTALRVSMDLMDGGDDGIDVSASIAIVDDGSVDDTGATVIEVSAGNDTWSVGIETADVEDMGSGSSLASGPDTLGALIGDTTPMVVSGSYNATEDWEVAVRFTDYDIGGLEIVEITANHYLDGHGLKWQIGIAQISADMLPDVDTVMVGLNVAF